MGDLVLDHEVIKPKLAEAKVDLGNTPQNMIGPMWNPGLIRKDGGHCYLAFMRVNKQLYEDGVELVYNRTFEVVMSARGTDFMEWHYAWKDRSEAVIPRDYRPYKDFPFSKVRTLRISVWPADLEYFLFHIQTEMVAFCKFLNWGKPWGKGQTQDIGKPRGSGKPQNIKRLEISFDRKPVIINGYEDEFDDFEYRMHYSWTTRYNSPWNFPTAKISTGLGVSDIELLLQPFTHLRGVQKATISLPKYCVPGTKRDDEEHGAGDSTDENKGLLLTCKEVINIAEAARQAILGPKNKKTEEAFLEMSMLAAEWWTEHMPHLRSTCGERTGCHPDHHDINIEALVYNEGVPKCMCVGSCFGKDFAILPQRTYKLQLPNHNGYKYDRYSDRIPVQEMVRLE